MADPVTDSEPVLRPAGGTMGGKSDIPLVRARMSFEESAESAEFVTVNELLQKAGSAPQVGMAFDSGRYKASTDGLRMIQGQLEAANQAMKAPLPTLQIIDGELPQLYNVQWDRETPQGVVEKQAITMTTGFLERVVFSDGAADVSQGRIGPSMLRALMAQKLAMPGVDEKLDERGAALAADEAAAKATGAPCQLADALQASARMTLDPDIKKALARAIDEGLYISEAAISDETAERTQLLHRRAQQAGKPCTER